MTTHLEPERELLEAGVTSYVPAVRTILAFRELVQSRCRLVAEAHWEEYSSALSASLEKVQFLPVALPAMDKWDSKWAWLGQAIKGVGDAKAYLYHGLYWTFIREDHWATEICAGIRLQELYQFNRLVEAFHPHPPNLTRDGHLREIWIYEQISRAEMADFDNRLEQVLCQWIDLWKRVGGLKVLGTGDTIPRLEDPGGDAPA